MAVCKGTMVVTIGSGQLPVSRLRTDPIDLDFHAPEKLQRLVAQQRFFGSPIGCAVCAFTNTDPAFPSGCQQLNRVRQYLTEAQELRSEHINPLIETCKNVISSTSDATVVFRSVQDVFDAVTAFVLGYQRGTPKVSSAPPIDISLFTSGERTLRRIARVFNELFPNAKPVGMKNAEVDKKILECLSKAESNSISSSINRVKKRCGGDWPTN